MKTKHIILTAILAASAALQTAVAENKLPAPKPEFKTQEQLVKWSEEKTKEAAIADSASAIRDSQFFYTGKPYLEESGTYAFLFRFYDPELSRWTTADPSGFPDGPNSSNYAPIPTSQLDYLGLAKLDADGGASLWLNYYRYGTVQSGGKTTLQAWERAGDWLLANHLTGDDEWENSCAIRLSIGLNGSGNAIPSGPTSNLSLGERYIITAAAMNTYISNAWGASDRTVASAGGISTLQADLATYSQALNKSIYAVAINNGHVSMISSSYTDSTFAALYGGSYNVWILE
jgi:RHS repeat-associated protein